MTTAGPEHCHPSIIAAEASRRPRLYRYQGEIMTHRVDDVRIREIKELAPPSMLSAISRVRGPPSGHLRGAARGIHRDIARGGTTGCW